MSVVVVSIAQKTSALQRGHDRRPAELKARGQAQRPRVYRIAVRNVSSVSRNLATLAKGYGRGVVVHTNDSGDALVRVRYS